jgi:glyoxylase-like metal-dependent hydrolase (beta-lactamase superfamily II)
MTLFKDKTKFSVCDDVYIVGGQSITSSEDCCVYLVDGKDELALIDSGLGRTFEKIVENIRHIGFNPKNISTLITTHNHIDHIGSHCYFQKKFGTKIIAHELDSDAIEKGGTATAAKLYGIIYVPCHVDVKLKLEDERVKVGKHELVCLHTPGHTPGSISALLVMEKLKVLFAQDVHGPFSSAWGSNIEQWKNSVSRLIGLDADVLCEGHFGVFKPAENVRKYLREQLNTKAFLL